MTCPTEVFLRRRIYFAILSLYSFSGFASQGTHRYYLGEQTVTSPEGKVLRVSPFFVEKIEEPLFDKFQEKTIDVLNHGCVVRTNYEYSVDVRREMFSLDVSVITGGVVPFSGSGKVYGPAWNWRSHSSKYSFRGYHYEWESFFPNPKTISASGKLFDTSGREMFKLAYKVDEIEKRLYHGLTSALLVLGTSKCNQ